jgi:hypothetical protein
MDIEKDVHIALCGGEGDGKSQMGYQFIREFPDANFWDNVVYTGNPKELSDKYANLQKKSIMVLDEALNSISRLDWNNADVKSMVKFFRTVVRKEKMSTWIYLCQLLRDMHGFWRNHRCTWLIEMGVREFYDPSCNGVFVFHRTRVPFLTGKRDVWLLDDQENFWLGEARKYKIGGTNYANMLRMHPYYFGEISVGKLPQSVWDEYEKNRKKAYAEYTPDEEKPLGKREIKMQEKLVKIIELAKDRGIEEREIALAIGVTPGSFSSTKLRYRDKITTY